MGFDRTYHFRVDEHSRDMGFSRIFFDEEAERAIFEPQFTFTPGKQDSIFDFQHFFFVYCSNRTRNQAHRQNKHNEEKRANVNFHLGDFTGAYGAC